MEKEIMVVADLTALRAVGTRRTGLLSIVLDSGVIYSFTGTSTASDDGAGVIKPAALDNSKRGRWLRIASTAGAGQNDPGLKAVNTYLQTTVGKPTETVLIGADTYEVTTKDSLGVTSGRIAIDCHAGATVKARGRITFGGLPTDGDTVTIGGKVYTFEDSLTNVDGHVKIGATAEACVDNLVAAVNLGAGPGTAYAAATTAPTTFTAVKSSTDKVLPQAISGGVVGNSITLTESADNVTVDGAVLGTERLGVDPSAENVIDGLVAAINAHGTEAITAVKISAGVMLLTADAVGVVTTACTDTMTSGSFGAAAMAGGRTSAARKCITATRVPTAQEVTNGNLHIALPFTPSRALVQVRVTSSGDAKAWAGLVTLDSVGVHLANDGGADWAATDTITVLAEE